MPNRFSLARLSIFCLVLLFTLFNPVITQQRNQNRQPAVAGQFYPADPLELKTLLESLFAHAEPRKTTSPAIALISPHAGYVYSGTVAASSFHQLDPSKQYDNIFLLGSSHHVAFEGASIYSIGDFVTPLGIVPVNTTLSQKLIIEHSCFISRDDAHAQEHSLEVQLPFLQYRMKKSFKIVPIVLGTDSPDQCREIAEALRPYFTPNNLFVISTDFSHYPDYDHAKDVDRESATALVSGSPEKFIQALVRNSKKGIPNLATSACGWTSILTLLYLTNSNPAFTYTPIVYKNSGDTDKGDKAKVVGYHSIIITQREKASQQQFNLTEKDKQTLLSIARTTLDRYVRTRTVPAIDTAGFSSQLITHCGAFVTLNKNHQLRGCIGRFSPDIPLYEVVQQMAIASSTQDTRFSPVKPEELNEITVEISVLTPMKKINSPDELTLGKHGVYLRKGDRSGTFLPQVATETGWSKEEFLGHCARDKAGLGWDGWKDADLFVYEAIVFDEHSKGK